MCNNAVRLFSIMNSITRAEPGLVASFIMKYKQWLVIYNKLTRLNVTLKRNMILHFMV